MPGCACGGCTRTSTSPRPPTADNGRPTCTAPRVGMFAHPASTVANAATTTATCGRCRSDIGRLRARLDAHVGHRTVCRGLARLDGVERKRWRGDPPTGLPRQRQAEDTTLAGLSPGLQPAAVQPSVL